MTTDELKRVLTRNGAIPITPELELLCRLSLEMGYTFRETEAGIEMVRPDGSVAIRALRPKVH